MEGEAWPDGQQAHTPHSPTPSQHPTCHIQLAESQLRQASFKSVTTAQSSEPLAQLGSKWLSLAGSAIFEPSCGNTKEVAHGDDGKN